MTLRAYAVAVTVILLAVLTNPSAEKHYASLEQFYPWVDDSLLRDAEARYEIFGQINEPFVGFDDENPPQLIYKSLGVASLVQSKSRFQTAEASAFQWPISFGLLGYVWVKPPSQGLYEKMDDDAVKKSAKKISDPAAEFSTAYREFQEAEQLAVNGKLEEASEKFRDVLRALEQIKSQHPEWQPMVVNFRRQKTLEALAKLPASSEDIWH